MANVQVENGYTRIANDLFNEILRRDFNQRQLKILFLLIRLTYGFQQTSVELKNIDFQACGIERTHIKKIITKLKIQKIIFAENSIYSVNKNFDEWKIGFIDSFEKLDMLLKREHECYKKSNKDVTKSVTNMLPKREHENLDTTLTESDTCLPKEKKEKKEIKESSSSSGSTIFQYFKTLTETKAEQGYQAYGEFKNVYLTASEKNNLDVLTFSKEYSAELIEDLSQSIETGNENPHISMGNGHFARLKAFLSYRKTHPKKKEYRSGTTITNSEHINSNTADGWEL